MDGQQHHPAAVPVPDTGRPSQLDTRRADHRNRLGGTVNRLCGTYFGQGGSVNQYQYGALTFPSPVCSTATSSSPSLNQGGDWRVNDTGRRIGLNPEEDRYGIFGRLSFDVTDGITLFAEASYNRQETLFNAGPNLMTGLSIAASNCGAGRDRPDDLQRVPLQHARLGAAGRNHRRHAGDQRRRPAVSRIEQ